MRTVQFLLVVQVCWITASWGQTHGDIRLADSYEAESYLVDGSMVGRVEIFWNGRWGTINYNTESDSDGQAGAGQAVCRQLGFDLALETDTVTRRFVGQADESVPILLTNTSCPYTEYRSRESLLHILRCSYQLANGLESHRDDMAVVCTYEVIELYYNTQVRLVQSGTNFTSSGFVEIYTHETWGPICNLGQQDANTVCRQLGYTNAASHGSSTHYNGSAAKLDKFTCSSASYPCLTSCFSYPSVRHIASCSEFSYVNCTFDELRSNASSAGSYTLCDYSYSPPVDSVNWAALIGGILGSVFLVALMVSIAGCLTVPFCNHGRASRDRRYENFDTESSSPPDRLDIAS